MNPAVLSALSALFGSLIGASASVVTSWLAQRGQSLSAQRSADLKSRETLYSEFILEASERYAEALEADAPDTHQFARLLALVNRIRLYADEATILAADAFINSLIQTYYAPRIDLKHASNIKAMDRTDPLIDFSTKARRELVAMR